MTSNGYEEIFIPLPDVFDEGGPEGITEFQRKNSGGRNLVVVPLNVINSLEQLELQEHSYGAEAALGFINKIQREGHRVPLRGTQGNGKHIYRVFDSSLDLCILSDPEFAKADISMSDLEKNLKSAFKLDRENIKVITSRNAQRIKLTMEGVSVEEPSFLIVDEKIVHKGMLVGNSATQAKLRNARHQTLSADIVSDLMETPLLLNQFIRFPDPARPSYAVVTGKPIYNSPNSRIIGVDNLAVKLLPEQEYSKILHYGGDRGSAGIYTTQDILGVRPFDMEQYLTIQYGLIPQHVSMFFLCGKPGSGKTVLTYAHAIDSILKYDLEDRRKRGMSDDRKERFFDQVILMKAPEILGGKRRDPGALPGDLFMKLKNHLAPYKDAHGQTLLADEVRFEDLFLHPKFSNDFGSVRADRINKLKIAGRGYLPVKNEAIELVYSGFIGGRSKMNTLIVVDEAQDFTPYEMKTILERVGMGSSVIVLGDPNQVRNPSCTLKKNGLTYAIKNYYGKPYAGLLALSRNYRAQISEDAENMHTYNVR